MYPPGLSGSLLDTDCESPGLSFGSPKSLTYKSKILKYIYFTLIVAYFEHLQGRGQFWYI